jgi:energy-coupling factor transport system permease protein
MAKFLEYVPGTSFVHRMNPVAKLACALLISVACFCTSNVVFLLCVLAADFVLARACGMTRQALGLARAVCVFSVVLAAIALLTTPAGTLLAAVVIIVRLVACAIPLFLVMYVTKLTDIANACCKILHVPYKYAFTFTSAVHFIPVFMNDMAGIMEAQTARGVEFDGGMLARLKLMVPLCVPLLVSSVRKTSSAAIAAEVRGFNLRTRQSGFKEYPFAARDVAAMLICAVILVASITTHILL